jgi:hypothetical protein
MYLPVVLFYIIVLGIFLVILYRQGCFKNDLSEGYSNDDTKGDSEGYSKDNSCLGSRYKTLNMPLGGDPWKCNSCTTYGSVFDYKKQLGDQTYGVHNGCQKIF